MGIHVRLPFPPPLPIQTSNSNSNRNYKCSDSEEEDDDEDVDANDPATWFEDDQDDGRKGQNLIEPDNPDEYEIDPNIISVDYGKVYEFRDGPGPAGA